MVGRVAMEQIKEMPNSCIECKKADCIGYCKELKDREEDYALKRHSKCPLDKEAKGD